MFLLIHEFTGELERGPDVGAGQVVFTFHFFKAHTAGEATDNQRNGHPRPANDRLAMADVRVNDDLVVHGLSLAPHLVLTNGLFLLPMHLRRDFQAQAVQADETGGVVLILVRVQDETNNPRPGANAPHSVAI